MEIFLTRGKTLDMIGKHTMRKEVLIAILLGGILGLAIAFGVWRANVALNAIPQIQQLTRSDTTPGNGQETTAGSLVITEPENNTLTTSGTITIKGKAEKNSTIVITSPKDEISAVADSQGNWSSDIKLDSGANAILVVSINENGEEEIEELTVIYSTEFKEER